MGKSVLITGATSGIGNGMAQAFASAGANIVATGATMAEIDKAPELSGVAYRHLDVRDEQAIRDLASSIPTIDVLVNCAGINRLRDEFDPAIFDNVLAVNLGGTNRMCAACHPKMAPGSAILNIASMYSFAGAGHAPAYAASKGGVAQLTKSLAIAYAAKEIRVNAVAPGWIDTPMTGPAQADPARNAAILARTPMGRWGKPDDVADVALFLCSPLARFVTGAILPVDGGYLAV